VARIGKDSARCMHWNRGEFSIRVCTNGTNGAHLSLNSRLRHTYEIAESGLSFLAIKKRRGYVNSEDAEWCPTPFKGGKMSDNKWGWTPAKNDWRRNDNNDKNDRNRDRDDRDYNRR
jgi:hypothetical protein